MVHLVLTNIKFLKMDITQADQYYLKARNNFPYEMETALENLNYALSFDDEHAPANCLLGQIFMFYLKDYEKAEQCFVQALQSNLSYPDTYKYFAMLKIWNADINGALKLINYAMKLKAMDRSSLLTIKALGYECRGQFKLANEVLNEATSISVQCHVIDYIDSQKQRIKKKEKHSAKNGKPKKEKQK